MRRTVSRAIAGYTLVELVVVIFVFSIVMTLISTSFSKIVSNSGQVMKSVETDIGGLIGLELLRIDLEMAGYGLPWSLGSVTYSESESHQVGGIAATDAANFNDSPNNPPRAFVQLNDKGFNASDYLVLKATPLYMTNSSSYGWSYLNYSSPVVKPSKSEVELVASHNDRVIVLDGGVENGVPSRKLVTVGGTGGVFYAGLNQLPDDFKPKSYLDRYFVYGIAPPQAPADPNDKITFPFNRVDYYLGPSANLPANCAPGTGRLYRAVVSQKGNFKPYPVLDCVADLQVVFYLDTSNDGSLVPQHLDDYCSSVVAGGDSAEATREHVKEVRVYVLVQQGRKDAGYVYPDTLIAVGDRTWGQPDLLGTFGPDWMHYRWKVFTIAVQPKNLQPNS